MHSKMENDIEQLKKELKVIKIFAQDASRQWNLENRVDKVLLLGKKEGLWTVLDSCIRGNFRQTVNNYRIKNDDNPILYGVDIDQPNKIHVIKDSKYARILDAGVVESLNMSSISGVRPLNIVPISSETYEEKDENKVE